MIPPPVDVGDVGLVLDGVVDVAGGWLVGVCDGGDGGVLGGVDALVVGVSVGLAAAVFPIGSTWENVSFGLPLR